MLTIALTNVNKDKINIYIQKLENTSRGRPKPTV